MAGALDRGDPASGSGAAGLARFAAQSEWVRREYTEALATPGRLRIDLLDDTPLPESLAEIQAQRSAFSFPASDRWLRLPWSELPENPQPSHLLRPEFSVVP